MASKVPQSSKTAFAIIKSIISNGSIEIPEQFRGSGAPGNTLEFMLNLKQNNNDSPDLLDWEIKFHGGNSLLTLFHKDPQPKGILDKAVDAFGWEDKHNRISFRHTLGKSKSKHGFIVTNASDRITITNPKNLDIVPYWEHNIILGAIAAKLRRLILVHGKVSKDKKHVIYNSATAYWDLNLLGICKAIEDGIIHIDFDARTNLGRGTSLRNHGTKFRIKINDIGVLYENSQVII